MPKKNPKLSDEENRAKYREYQARYRAKKAEQQRQAGNDTPKSKPAAKALETLKTENLTDAEVAALVNASHGYSAIVAESRHGNRIVIAERMISASLLVFGDGNGSYRVKDTRYHNFSSRQAALQWMRDNGCRGLKEY